MITVTITPEELEALIEFQRSMRDTAEDSCEFAEAGTRRARIWELLQLKQEG